MKTEDATKLALSYLIGLERNFRLWGMSEEEAWEAIDSAVVAWNETEVEIAEGFVGDAGYTKRDELHSTSLAPAGTRDSEDK